MKKARKLTAVLLSLVMLLALVVPASAAENYSITIQNNKTGHTYEAYQIFAGTVSSDAATDGKTEGPMLGDITWGSGVDGAALLVALKATNAEKYGTCTTAADVAKALGTETATAADAAAFADIAAKRLTTAAKTATAPNDDGNYIIEGLDAGYYLVKDSLQAGDNQTGQVLSDYIVQVLGNVAMEPKDSDIPTVLKKVYDEEFAQDVLNHPEQPYGTGYNDVADWDIGDRVPFKLIATVPQNIDSYEEYTFIFHDTLSAGLTLDPNSLHVYVTETADADINGLNPQAATLYTVSEVAENGTFTVTIPNIKALDNHDHAANFIIVAYDAILNANAEIGLDGNPNSVFLEFSNDPNGDGLGRTAEDTVIVFTYELDGTKVDGETQEVLQNAQFVLLNGAKSEAAVVVDGKVTEWIKFGTQADGTKLEIPTTYEGWTTLAQQYNGLILTSDENGLFNIAGLDDGTYYLREIQAPNGYNLLEEDVQLVITATTANGQDWNSGIATDALTGLTITVGNGAAQNGVLDTGVVNVTVENKQGATLPETGGMGTTLFYIIGGLLVVGAGILLVVRIRMKAHNE